MAECFLQSLNSQVLGEDASATDDQLKGEMCAKATEEMVW